jgi:hypothetical protein
MKKLLFISCLVSLGLCADAQTWSEWFRQKKTQRKYLLQQIAALQVHLSYIKKGYDIAKTGLTIIGNIKDGDLSLHRDFFNALKQVNPKIRNTAKVADIIALQVRIVKNARATIANIVATGRFTQAEIDYCKRVLDNLLTECFQNLDELLQVITSGELEMKDDERIKQIDRIYLDMQDKFSFCASFSEEATVLALQRIGEQVEINRSKLIKGLQ